LLRLPAGFFVAFYFLKAYKACEELVITVLENYLVLITPDGVQYLVLSLDLN
jgi:hypothetical protein